MSFSEKPDSEILLLIHRQRNRIRHRPIHLRFLLCIGSVLRGCRMRRRRSGSFRHLSDDQAVPSKTRSFDHPSDGVWNRLQR